MTDWKYRQKIRKAVKEFAENTSATSTVTYPHQVWCSANRNKPIGSPGCSCNSTIQPANTETIQTTENTMTITMKPDWLRAIGKAASALRFQANQNDWYTEASRNELIHIASVLSEIESAAISKIAEPRMNHHL